MYLNFLLLDLLSFVSFCLAHFDVTFEQADERISHPACNGPLYRFSVYKFADYLYYTHILFVILSA